MHSNKKVSSLKEKLLDFDIDVYLNPLCPRSILPSIPKPISFWFGYREPTAKSQRKLPNVGVWISAFLGGFIGIAIIANVFLSLPKLGDYQVPIVIGSFGAAAILEYNTIDSPLSQPRNLFLGHFLSAVVGVAISKCFHCLPRDQFIALQWLAGSLAVGTSSLVMSITKTLHPPAGATALLATTSSEIIDLGWWLLPLVLLASTLMFVSALLVNNTTRRWPLYWWTPADLSKPGTIDIECVKAPEKQAHSDTSSDQTKIDVEATGKKHARELSPDIRISLTSSRSYSQSTEQTVCSIGKDKILITFDEIVLPDWWTVDERDAEMFSTLQARLSVRMVS